MRALRSARMCPVAFPSSDRNIVSNSQSLATNAVREQEREFAELSRLLRRRIDDALDAYSHSGPGCPPELAKAMRCRLLAPAKRLRPMLVLMACEACGCDSSRAMPAACAVEMVHTYSLIHDDLPAMDDDDLRRGQPSCHAKFGEATAILAGDALLAQAFEVLATDVQPAALAARCCAELAVAAGASNLVGGQEDDLQAEFAAAGIDELQRIHRRKTGAMIRVSLRLGESSAGRASRSLRRWVRTAKSSASRFKSWMTCLIWKAAKPFSVNERVKIQRKASSRIPRCS